MASYDRVICTPASFGDSNSLNVNAIAHRLFLMVLLSASSSSMYASAFTINAMDTATSTPSTSRMVRPKLPHRHMLINANAPIPGPSPISSSSRSMYLYTSTKRVIRTTLHMASASRATLHSHKLHSDTSASSVNAFQSDIVPALTEFSPAVSSHHSMSFYIFVNRAMNTIFTCDSRFPNSSTLSQGSRRQRHDRSFHDRPERQRFLSHRQPPRPVIFRLRLRNHATLKCLRRSPSPRQCIGCFANVVCCDF